jgi:F0F1-type ATP synthase membrane subunit c/vacuolar-type H+-ATPase subunit K
MVRTLFRLFVVLVIAAAVAAGLSAFSTTSLAQSLVPERGGRPPMEHVEEGEGTGFTAPEGAAAERHGPPRGDHDHERGEEGFSLLRALPGMGEHLAIIGLVVAAVVLLRSGLRTLKPRRSSQCSA